MNKELSCAFRLSVLSAGLAFFTALYSIMDTSVYFPSTPEHLLPGAVAQDIFSIVAATGSILCVILHRGGKIKALPVLAGMQGYLMYGYALYAFDRVYNELFILYPLIAGSSVFALILLFRPMDGRMAAGSGKPPPRKSSALLFALLGSMFLVLWLSLVFPAMSSRIPPEGNAIFVLDLAFFIPLLLAASVLLFRGRSAGDMIAVPLLVKMSMLGLSVLTGVLIRPFFSQDVIVSEVITYSLLGLGPLFFVPRWLGSITVLTGENR